MKRKILAVILFSVILLPTVSAKEGYYVNGNGVVFTKLEYEFFSKMYWEGYQDFVTQNEYDVIKNLDLFNQELEKETYVNYSTARGSTVTSNLRTLSIAKACNNSCYNTLVTTWIGNPFIKSYDVMGARLSGPNLIAINNLIVTGDNYYQSYSNPKRYSNGFGYSFQLPNTSNIRVTTSFTTSLNGMVYGSYQHAMSNIDLSVSNLYTIGVGGYGNVFHFSGSARNIYDNAPGVDIDL